ncbi:MAG: transcriptional repressor LexA [bacterium]
MKKEEIIYEFIRSEIESKGAPPTIREIGRHFNISSTNGVRYFLKKLENEGLIRRIARRARGISLIDFQPTAVNVPILGRISAGKPGISDEFIEDHIVIDKRISKGDRVFGLRVKGDSMVGAGIYDGDIAVVKQKQIPDEGEIVVAMIDGEVTLKRFLKMKGRPILRAENPNYSDIDLNRFGEGRVRILGSLISIIRRFY